MCNRYYEQDDLYSRVCSRMDQAFMVVLVLGAAGVAIAIIGTLLTHGFFSS